MNIEYLNKILAAGVNNNASDIHLKVGRAPMYRVNGMLHEIKAPKLTPEDTRSVSEALLKQNLTPINVDDITEYDSSYTLEGTGRFRMNIYKQRGNHTVILRVISIEIPSFEQLGLPPSLQKIASMERGMVLVTGVTGSGKSSTLAAIIDYINTNRNVHILTLEDPIEFVHPDKNSSVSQREVGQDSKSFSAGLRAALRQDPDVILVGEMRDFETIDIALKAAETGHLLLSTVHTTDAPSTINRLVAVFPAEQQAGARLRLAENLKASISQRLIRRADGKGRVAAAEIMMSSMSIQESIREPGKLSEMRGHIERGYSDGTTQSFDQHLTDLYRKGIVTLEDAKAAASSPADFERALNIE
ncbi:MAG: PilT/PilU family type 4a pilus ATPase [Chrysiogenetes bacterium]|nr:PilT/PilU family type 4a pilus ATPase [Chrysiogenetes bacterium]